MSVFHFKRFSVDDGRCAMKVGTDAVLLGAWVDISGVKAIVDAGCGSGVISLMLAQRCESARIYAIDIDRNACTDAVANVNATSWKNRVEVIEADVTTFFPEVDSPLLIVSNPPFFNETLRSPDSLRALARHGDEFGVRKLIELATKRLKTVRDSLAFIAPTSRSDEIDFILSLNRLSPRRICTVYTRNGKMSLRTLWQVGIDSLDAPKLICENLYIRDNSNNLTSQYLSLTSEFYLDK